MSDAKALMVQGCTSNAGKSYLVAGLCRLYANRGVNVAPFKAQNMSNNAGVTPDGLEIGRAQLLQAQAARVTPTVHMNPVLLKPEANTRSQVILHGKANPELSKLPWLERKQHLWGSVQTSLRTLQETYDLILMEGAGSPAEINLKASDIVNMRAAKEAHARVLLAVDIDKGGAFAHLLGTWHCLEQDEKNLLLGFILNKFRGDPALLGNAMSWLETKTRVPTLGVVPMLRLPLPEEDAFSFEDAPVRADKPVVAVLLTPFISNFDEFDALAHEPSVSLRFVKEVAELRDASAVILAGSKHVAADLEYLRASGLAAAVSRLADRGVPVLGICGGLQMLGERIEDPEGVEGQAGATLPGLGLLNVTTRMAPLKTTRLTSVTQAESAALLTGYEIHHGQTRAGNGVRTFLADGLGFKQGNVTGVYLHGLFDNAVFRQQFLSLLGVQASARNWQAQVDASLDTLAAHLQTHLDIPAIDKALGI